MTLEEPPDCTCIERIDAPGVDLHGMVVHVWTCAWLVWFIGTTATAPND